MPKKHKLLIIQISCIFLLLLVTLFIKKETLPPKKITPPMLQNVRELTTVKYTMKKIVKFNNPNILGGRELVLEIPVVIRAFIDLSEITLSDIKQNGNEVSFELPFPKIGEPEIQRECIVELHNYISFFRARFLPSEREEMSKKAKDDIMAEINNNKIDIYDRAKQSTKNAIITIANKIGYTVIDITFKPRQNSQSN